MSYELILCAVHTALCLDWPSPVWFRLDLKPMCCDIINNFVGFSRKWRRNSKLSLSYTALLCATFIPLLTIWTLRQTEQSGIMVILFHSSEEFETTVFFTCLSSVMHSGSPQLLRVAFQIFIYVSFPYAYNSQTNPSLSRLFFHSKTCTTYISAVILIQAWMRYETLPDIKHPNENFEKQHLSFYP